MFAFFSSTFSRWLFLHLFLLQGFIHLCPLAGISLIDFTLSIIDFWWIFQSFNLFLSHFSRWLFLHAFFPPDFISLVLLRSVWNLWHWFHYEYYGLLIEPPEFYPFLGSFQSLTVSSLLFSSRISKFGTITPLSSVLDLTLSRSL